MADTNVKIKFTADTSQVRQQLNQLNQDAKRLGRILSTQSLLQSQNSGVNTPGVGGQIRSLVNGTVSSSQIKRDRTLLLLTNESILIRRELQRLNNNISSSSLRGNGGSSGGNSGNGGSSGSSSGLPAPQGGGAPNNNNNPGGTGGAGGLGNILRQFSQLLSNNAGAIMGGISWISRNAKTAREARYNAYDVYGTSGWYDTDYSYAVKDDHSAGKLYGYDYNETLTTADTYKSLAGFIDKNQFNADKEEILRTARAETINPNLVAEVGGSAVQSGYVKQGDLKQISKDLGNIVVNSNLVGREDEALSVLKDILDQASNISTTVSKDQVNSMMGLYNAVVNTDKNLKGERGQQVASSMGDLAQSGNNVLDIMAGLNTKYVGLQGRMELDTLRYEDPGQYWKQVLEYREKTGMSDPQFYSILENSGASYQLKQTLLGLKSSDIDQALSEQIKQMESPSGTTAGEQLIDQNAANYQNTDEYSLKTYDNELTYSSLQTANVLGNNPFFASLKGAVSKNDFTANLMGPASLISTMIGGQFAFNLLGRMFGGGGGAGGGGLGGLFGNLFGRGTGGTVGGGLGSLFGNLFGRGGGTGGGTGGGGTGGGSGSGGRIADVLDDVVDGTGKIGRLGKILGLIGTAVRGVTGTVETVSEYQEGDYRESAQAAGETVGDIAGGWAGFAAGASTGAAAGAALGSVVPGLGTAVGAGVGGLVGGISGAMGGGAIGEWAGGLIGESIYDSTYGTNYKLTGEEQATMATLYEQAKGYSNWSEQKDFINSTVANQMRSMGISDSKIEDYKNAWFDYGFIKDYERGDYGFNLTAEQESQLASHYEKASELNGDLYSQQQDVNDYVNENVVPLLEEWGIPEAKIKEYTNQLISVDGSNGFLKDFENGVFGTYTNETRDVRTDKNAAETDDYTRVLDDQTNATDDNTEALLENTEALNKIAEGGTGSASGGQVNQSSLINLASQQNSMDYTISNASPLSKFSAGLNKITSVVNSVVSGVTGGNTGGANYAYDAYGNPASHATGNDYVPWDNYPALLHKGELVLTASEAAEYRENYPLDTESPYYNLTEQQLNTGESSGVAEQIDSIVNKDSEVESTTPGQNSLTIVDLVKQANVVNERSNSLISKEGKYSIADVVYSAGTLRDMAGMLNGSKEYDQDVIDSYLEQTGTGMKASSTYTEAPKEDEESSVDNILSENTESPSSISPESSTGVIGISNLHAANKLYGIAEEITDVGNELSGRNIAAPSPSPYSSINPVANIALNNVSSSDSSTAKDNTSETIVSVSEDKDALLSSLQEENENSVTTSDTQTSDIDTDQPTEQTKRPSIVDLVNQSKFMKSQADSITSGDGQYNIVDLVGSAKELTNMAGILNGSIEPSAYSPDEEIDSPEVPFSSEAPSSSEAAVTQPTDQIKRPSIVDLVNQAKYMQLQSDSITSGDGQYNIANLVESANNFKNITGILNGTIEPSAYNLDEGVDEPGVSITTETGELLSESASDNSILSTTNPTENILENSNSNSVLESSVVQASSSISVSGTGVININVNFSGSVEGLGSKQQDYLMNALSNQLGSSSLQKQLSNSIMRTPGY